MNERIRELAVQAGATFIKGYIELSDGQLMLSDEADVDHTNMDLEKFAELIIAKCIEEAGDPADGLIKGNTWHDGVRASIWSIRQYFGVK